eukprot:10362876-Alexandrium_andersonii.AAC.1
MQSIVALCVRRAFTVFKWAPHALAERMQGRQAALSCCACVVICVCPRRISRAATHKPPRACAIYTRPCASRCLVQVVLSLFGQLPPDQHQPPSDAIDDL